MKSLLWLWVVFSQLLFVNFGFAWSEGGHHLVALIAFDRLPQNTQADLLALLRNHPRFGSDFKPPKSMDAAQVDRWLVGRAAYWPDVARSNKLYDRPTWHYQLGASLTLGNAKLLSVHAEPGPLPPNANLKTQELHIAQAIVLCGQTLRDRSKPLEDRAIALCWLGHLVGDAHQPCHAGSLYAEGIFPEGDRGGNSIPTKQEKNLHALWDSLLGKRFDSTSTNRRLGEITADKELLGRGAAAIDGKDDRLIQTWLKESRDAAVDHVYSPEIIQAVSAASRIAAEEPEMVELPGEYLSNAGRVAQVRAIEAGYRLAEVWKSGL